MLITVVGLALAEPGADLLVRHARLWDGTGGEPVPDAWVAVTAGRITAVGREPATVTAAETLDAGGQFLIPGLIDAHVHLEAVPGAALRGDDAAALEAGRRHGLRAYPAAGVTTVLDTGISFSTLAEIRGWMADGAAGPRVLTLGPVIGPRDGYVAAFLPQHPGLDTIEEIRQRLDQLVEVGASGVKLTIEEGYMLPVLPMHAPELRSQIVAEATARGLPVYVHAQHSEAHHLALDAGAHAIVHMSRGRDRTLAARTAEAGTWLVTTLNIDGAPLERFQEAPWSDPLSELLIPEAQRQTALSAEGWRQFKRGMAAVSLPGMPTWLSGLGSRFFSARRFFRRGLAAVMRNTREAHEAGVPLVIGSDAGAYDTIPFYFHGLSTLSEVARVVEAGITPAAALYAATGASAEMLGRAGELGSITPGAAADMVLLRADPLEDPAALRQIIWSMQAGIARSPAEWLEVTAQGSGDAEQQPDGDHAEGQ